jgi:hypothetical protein
LCLIVSSAKDGLSILPCDWRFLPKLGPPQWGGPLFSVNALSNDLDQMSA